MRVALADDSMPFREGLARLLGEAGVEVVGTAPEATALEALLETTPCDVAIVDIRMPPTRTDEGLRAARAIKAAHPDTGVVVLSQYLEPHYALSLIEDGTPEELLQADEGEYAALHRQWVDSLV